MVADAVEAIVGAIYLDGGYEKARGFIILHFIGHHGLEAVVGFDPKSRLQEWCQKRHVSLPMYRLLDVTGPPHSHVFTVAACLFDGTEAKGIGSTKKEAEMEAASLLLLLIGSEEAVK